MHSTRIMFIAALFALPHFAFAQEPVVERPEADGPVPVRPQPELPIAPQPISEGPAWTGTLERISSGVVSIRVDSTRAFDTERTNRAKPRASWSMPSAG